MTLLFFLLLPTAAAMASLPLEDYLSQVRANHLGYQASKEASESGLRRSGESALLTSPTFFSTLQWASDTKKSPFFAYEKLLTNAYTIGLSQNTPFGLQAKLSYNLNYTNYVGLRPAYYEGKPTLELSQSLLRNSFGAETRAIQNVQEAQALASHFGESFKMKLLLADAEQVYWRLLFARRHTAIQKEALERSQKIKAWTQKRSQLRLGDNSDLLQAEAALELRKLQVESALNEERAATLNFNQMRGIGGAEEKIEELQEIQTDLLLKSKPLKSAKTREDIEAAIALEKAAFSNAETARERDKPLLEVFASLSFNSRGEAAGNAFQDSLKTEQPTTLFGLRLSAPLDFGTIREGRAGWQQEQKAADLALARKKFDFDQEWADHCAKFEEAKKRFLLARSIEEAQIQKLQYEKDRLTRGRTTTYQVLLFEQDYAQSQITRLQIQTELLHLQTRLKLFGGPTE